MLNKLLFKSLFFINRACSRIRRIILFMYYSNLLYFLGITQNRANINGKLFIRIHPLSKCYIGKNFIVNSEINAIDGGKSIIIVRKEAEFWVGNNTGISSTCLYVSHKVTIGNNVKIGAGCVVTIDIPDDATVVMDKPRIILHRN